jgi:hypothetical protein
MCEIMTNNWHVLIWFKKQTKTTGVNEFVYNKNWSDIRTIWELCTDNKVPSWSYGRWLYNYLCNHCLSPPGFPLLINYREKWLLFQRAYREKWEDFWEKLIAINWNIVSRPLWRYLFSFSQFRQKVSSWINKTLLLVK